MKTQGLGVDSIVNQKVDAYRNNPQALQQRYAQNQELLDLLALQKIKSEKEAAARDMQMKMQQNPQTIADQRAKEVLALTKNEMVGQIGALKQQQHQKAQQNMQRLANSGVAGVPAPNISAKKMASGGIVGYKDGGDIPAWLKFLTPTEWKRYLEGFEPTEEQILRAKERQANADLEQGEITPLRKITSSGQVEGEAAAGTFARREAKEAAQQAQGIEAVAPQAQITSTPTPMPEAKPQVPVGTGSVLALPEEPKPTQAGTTQTSTGADSGISAVADAMGAKPTTADAVAQAKAFREASPMYDLAQKEIDDRIKRDPTQEGIARRKEAQEYMGMTPEERQRRDARMAKMADIEARMGDSEANKRKRLIQALLGAGNRSGIGSVLGGMGAGYLREGERQQTSMDKFQKDMLGIEEGFTQADMGVREKAFTRGAEAEKNAEIARNVAAQAAASLANNDMQTASKSLTQLTNIYTSDMNMLRQLKSNESAQKVAKIRAQSAIDVENLKARLQQTTLSAKDRIDLQSKVTKNYQDALQAIEQAYNDASLVAPSPEQREKLMEERQKQINSLNLVFAPLRNQLAGAEVDAKFAGFSMEDIIQ